MVNEVALTLSAQSAVSRLSKDRSALIDDEPRQPTIILENTSMTKAVLTNPDQVAT
jgi:hypothetical protein